MSLDIIIFLFYLKSSPNQFFQHKNVRYKISTVRIFLNQTMTKTRKWGKFYIIPAYEVKPAQSTQRNGRAAAAIKGNKEALAGHLTSCQVHVHSKSLIETRLSTGFNLVNRWTK